MFYIIDYSEKGKEIYRIGKTNNMKNRKSVYDTHTLHKHKVVFYQDFCQPISLESCVRGILHNFRYMNKGRDYYECDLTKIISTVKHCVKGINCVNKRKQYGGSKTNKKMYKNNFIFANTNGTKISFNNRISFLKNKSKILSARIEKIENKIKKPQMAIYNIR